MQQFILNTGNKEVRIILREKYYNFLNEKLNPAALRALLETIATQCAATTSSAWRHTIYIADGVRIPNNKMLIWFKSSDGVIHTKPSIIEVDMSAPIPKDVRFDHEPEQRDPVRFTEEFKQFNRVRNEWLEQFSKYTPIAAEEYLVESLEAHVVSLEDRIRNLCNRLVITDSDEELHVINLETNDNYLLQQIKALLISDHAMLREFKYWAHCAIGQPKTLHTELTDYIEKQVKHLTYRIIDAKDEQLDKFVSDHNSEYQKTISDNQLKAFMEDQNTFHYIRKNIMISLYNAACFIYNASKKRGKLTQHLEKFNDLFKDIARIDPLTLELSPFKNALESLEKLPYLANLSGNESLERFVNSFLAKIQISKVVQASLKKFAMHYQSQTGKQLFTIDNSVMKWSTEAIKLEQNLFANAKDELDRLVKNTRSKMVELTAGARKMMLTKDESLNALFDEARKKVEVFTSVLDEAERAKEQISHVIRLLMNKKDEVKRLYVEFTNFDKRVSEYDLSPDDYEKICSTLSTKKTLEEIDETLKLVDKKLEESEAAVKKINDFIKLAADADNVNGLITSELQAYEKSVHDLFNRIEDNLLNENTSCVFSITGLRLFSECDAAIKRLQRVEDNADIEEAYKEIQDKINSLAVHTSEDFCLVRVLKRKALQAIEAFDSTSIIEIDVPHQQNTLPLEKYKMIEQKKKAEENDLWLKWIIIGCILGAVVAVLVIASVVTAGALPTALVGATIGVAVSIVVGSSVIGGFVSALIQKCRDYFKSGLQEVAVPKLRLSLIHQGLGVNALSPDSEVTAPDDEFEEAEESEEESYIPRQVSSAEFTSQEVSSSQHRHSS